MPVGGADVRCIERVDVVCGGGDLMMVDDQDIAVIGLACRFPGAPDAARFWDNLVAGVESITFFTDDDLRESGVGRDTWSRHDYVRAAPVIDDHDRFDAAFFGYSPREAALLDPQQRVFLECSWSALEDSGYEPGAYQGAVGVFAGAAMNTYLLSTAAQRAMRDNYLFGLVANDKDFLTSRVSYKLNLTGPSMTVQTACSTSLVAVHLACQSLLNGECDMALCGGVAVKVPHKEGYVHEPDGVLSPDGHCRAFDARAAGTLFGSGVGVVVLKPLAQAVSDGDHVRAVIKGSAVNNDGAGKVDYAAPSVTGQAEVVSEALANAGVDPETVSYLEAHGTGTALGDPVEIAALTQAFNRSTRRNGFCAIGSVKTNIGHLDAAAGVAGLIKTVLALQHRKIPPSLHFESPNPEIDFGRTPFVVNTRLTDWHGPLPLRAGVSSLGIGGTNAHVVLEEAPSTMASGPSRPLQLLLLSARTTSALETTTRNLSDRLGHAPPASLADVAYTLQLGRRGFRHRRAVVCRNAADAAEVLGTLPPKRVRSGEATTRSVVFMFPGGGSRNIPALTELYAVEPVFRDEMDRGLAELQELSKTNFRRLLLDHEDGERDQFSRPSVQLPAVLLVEQALAALWMSWGVRPSAMVGHSLGEITAACISGVMSRTDALSIAVVRGRLLEAVGPGAMLSVNLPEKQLVPLLDAELDLASVNAPDTCVVSGEVTAIDRLGARLVSDGAEVLRLPLSAAAHSSLLDPVLRSFEKHVAGLTLTPPSVPFLSNVTGTWITAAEATSPAYWSQQLRSTVRLSDAIGVLLEHPGRLFLEVGPGRALSTLVRFHFRHEHRHPTLTSYPLSAHTGPSLASLLDTLGQLWLAGVNIDWTEFWAQERRHRVPLPTYPFQRQRHWLDGNGAPSVGSARLLGHRLWEIMRNGKAKVSSKVRRARHRIPAHRSSARHASTVRGRDPQPSETEHQVTEIWREVLGTLDISRHDDFFELGGNSMMVTQVIRRINHRFGIELSLLTLVESPTVAGLAECIDELRAGQPG
ncbi:hypothetical protein GCM10012275_27110 [Longimycelium tulufanense]|uniref:Polyketide synthase n=1 Tax=Longimycelium tulufanense TaxID=907463 RepID=A0A8J3FVW2_9PSEU|nr:type I polyketide synthase [Longimycelium tulufanense]GGM54557.1 hypothetical protein GCM10012275_27110 [Longimycelium tulufanense]